MCISNVRKRRPYTAGSLSTKLPQDVSLLNRAASLKDHDFRDPASVVVDMMAFNPEPLAPEVGRVEGKPSHNAHITVQHDYHDHIHDSRTEYVEEHPTRGGVTTPFPLRLHDMLENVEADGNEHIVSWQPHGRCFVVHKPKEFVELLPSYFKLSKLASFQRQLNLYGFQRLTRGRDRGGYYHELFLKGKIFLAHSILRLKVKGTGVRARSNPDQEPNFWFMPFVNNNVSDSEATPAKKSALSHPSVEKAIAQLPAKLTPPVPLQKSFLEDQDTFLAFEKTFHYLDPFQPTQGTSLWTLSGVDELLASEAESFFEDFEFPEHIGEEIEDDDVFGDMLEQMIA
jgi:hypothetical protein